MPELSRIARGFALFFAVCTAQGLAEPATAGLMGFTGTMTIEVGAQTPFVLAGAGVADLTIAGSQLTRISIPSGVFVGTGMIPLGGTLAPLVGVSFSVSNPAIVLSASQPACDVADPALACLGTGPLHGRAGLVGKLVAGLLGTPASPLTVLTLPASPVGGAGSFFATNTAIAAGVRLVGAGWTTGTAVVFGTNGLGTPYMDSVVGSADLAAGTLQLVTPFVIRSSLGVQGPSGFARIQLVLVPEPDLSLLFGTSLVLLAAEMARARRLRRGHG